MKIHLFIVSLMLLISCGKKIDDKAVIKDKKISKVTASQPETWSILSDRPLPAKVNVIINEMEFVNECTSYGHVVFERTHRNGTIHISSLGTFRRDYFNIEIFNCENGSTFFTQEYVDQQLIDSPNGEPIRIILRLRN
jgi:hypothetical protein